MFSISPFDIIIVVVASAPKILLCIPASAVDDAASNPNGIRKFWANGWTTFFSNGKPVFNNRPSSLPRNPLGCTILDIWIFDSLILEYK